MIHLVFYPEEEIIKYSSNEELNLEAKRPTYWPIDIASLWFSWLVKYTSV